MDLPTFLGTAVVVITVAYIITVMGFWWYDVFRNPGYRSCNHDWRRGYLVTYAGAFRQCENCREAQVRLHWWSHWRDYREEVRS